MDKKHRIALFKPTGPPSPEISLSPTVMGDVHTILVIAYRRARNSADLAYRAYQEAAQARERTYGALAKLEAEMLEFYEKNGWDLSEFLTIEKDKDDE